MSDQGLHLLIGADRAARWRECVVVDFDTDVPAQWAADRLREFGGWRWLKGREPSPGQLRSIARWCTGGGDEDDGEAGQGQLTAADVGYLKLLEALGDIHRDLCIELGRWAEICCADLAQVVEAIGAHSARFALTSGGAADVEAELWRVRCSAGDIQGWEEEAQSLGFDSLQDWAVAVIDVMADRQLASFGMREGIVESQDRGAATAPVDGLVELLEAWDESDDLSRTYLVDHLEEAARYARMVMALRAGVRDGR